MNEKPDLPEIKARKLSEPSHPETRQSKPAQDDGAAGLAPSSGGLGNLINAMV